MGAFSDVVNIALTLPTKLYGAAEAAVTDAVKLFNDIESGAIVDDLESLPGVVVSEVTAGWGDFTAGIVDDWNAVKHGATCFFGGCATATATPGSCGPASTFTPTAGTPTQTLITSVVTPGTGAVYSIVVSSSIPGIPHSSGPLTSSNTGVTPANLGIKTTSSPFESNGINLCAVAFLAVFGAAVLL